MRVAACLCLVLVACANAVRPADHDAFVDRKAVLCEDRLRTFGIDADAENARAVELARQSAPNPRGFHALIVPGYTPPDAKSASADLDPIAKERLFRAVLALKAQRAPFVIVSGGNVYPADTPYNEALQMKRYLRALGVPEERILIEPCSRYSYTNLRNAGRMMLALGMWRGLVITSYDQAFYLSRPLATTFRVRTTAKLGYWLGNLQIVLGQDVLFVPSTAVFARGRDPLDP